MSFRFSGRRDIENIIRQIEDNYVSHDKDGHVTLDGDITARDGYFDAESVYLGTWRVSAPVTGQDKKVLSAVMANKPNQKRDLGSFVDSGIPVIVSKTSAYTAKFNELVLSTGTFTVTLPNITSTDLGRRIIVHCISGLITLSADGADTIHGETSQLVRIGDSFVLIATTTGTWRVT